MFIASMLMLTNTNAQAQTICEFDIGEFTDEIETDSQEEFTEVKFVAARKGTNFQIKACNHPNLKQLEYLYVSSAFEGEDTEIFQVINKNTMIFLKECYLNDQQTDLTMYATDPVAFANAFVDYDSCMQKLENGGCYT